jgi:hypothetical protein
VYDNGQIIYTPAVTGTYYIQIQAGGNSDTYQLTAVATGASFGGPQLPDVFGVPVGDGTYSGVLDSTTYPNAVYAVTLFAGEEVQLTVSNDPNGSANTMLLLPPSTQSIANASSLMTADTDDNWDGYDNGQIIYTPAVTGTYYIQIQAGGNNDIFGLAIAGSAAKPLYPTHVFLHPSRVSARRGARVKLYASLVGQNLAPIAGKSLVLLYSTTGKTWKTGSKLRATGSQVTFVFALKRTTYFRVCFKSDGTYASGFSRRVVVKVK